MQKVARCRDIGLDCDFEGRGQTDEEIVEICAQHMQAVHGMDENPVELAERMVAATREKQQTAA